MVGDIEARCAVMQLLDGLVINIIVALPTDEPQIGCELIEIADGQPCNIGWHWNGYMFVDPFPPPLDIEG